MIDLSIQKELNRRFNPDGSLLRKHQMRMLEMLKYIDEICNVHGIQYWLSSGTLIGAIRHEGFIPWDDDLDIEMTKEDFKKFVKIISEDKNSGYVLQTHKTDFNYFAPYAKLRDLHSKIKEDNTNDSHYKYNGVYIDVFIMVPSSSSKINDISDKFQFFLLYKPNTFIKNGFLRKVYFSTVFFILNSLVYPAMEILSSFGAKDQLRHVPGSGFVKPRNKNDIFPLIKVPFEDGMFSAPRNYDNYLRQIYGNYMALPDIDKIKVHTTNVEIF